jgi:hypothetical protein
MQNSNTTTFDSRDVEYHEHAAASITGVDTRQHASTASEGGGNTTKIHDQPDV